MRTVFIGGSRRIGRLNEIIRARLENIVTRGLHVVIGDANGSDRAVQEFLAERGHKDVVVYCTEGDCRNNIGAWPVQAVDAAGTRGFEFYAQKDAEMARVADCGLMIWDAKSKGTFQNMRRLVELDKPVVVYVTTDRHWRTVRTRADLKRLVGLCAQPDRQRLTRSLEDWSSQSDLFPSRGSLAS